MQLKMTHFQQNKEMRNDQIRFGIKTRKAIIYDTGVQA